MMYQEIADAPDVKCQMILHDSEALSDFIFRQLFS